MEADGSPPSTPLRGGIKDTLNIKYSSHTPLSSHPNAPTLPTVPAHLLLVLTLASSSKSSPQQDPEGEVTIAYDALLQIDEASTLLVPTRPASSPVWTVSNTAASTPHPCPQLPLVAPAAWSFQLLHVYELVG